jgi:hypothetical protein
MIEKGAEVWKGQPAAFKGSRLRKLLRKIHGQGAAASQLRRETVDGRRLFTEDLQEYFHYHAGSVSG